MNRQEFIEKYKLSDSVPIDPSSKSISAIAFAEAIAEFINENFRGIADVGVNVKSNASVMICAEYTAFYFKTLLSFLHGSAYLNISIQDDKDAVRLTIKADKDMPLTFEETAYLIKIARNAGMEIYPDKDEFRLSLSYSEAASRGVYAISVADGKRILIAKFNEIFF